MRPSLLSLAGAFVAAVATPAFATIVYQQVGTVDDNDPTIEIPRLDLAPGIYQAKVQFDQPDLNISTDLGIGVSYGWICGTPLMDCGGDDAVGYLDFAVTRFGGRTGFRLSAGFSGPDPTFPIQPAIYYEEPNWFTGGHVEPWDADYHTPFTNFVFQINSVPEPTGWALMVMGFNLVGLSIRKQSATGSVQIKLAA